MQADRMRSIFGVFNVLGSLLMLFARYYAARRSPSALVYGENPTAVAFLVGGARTAAAGCVLRLLTRRFREELKPRDGYLLVTLGWLLR